MKQVDPSEQDHIVAGVRGRASVRKLSEDDPAEALNLARQIQHPWYRCQALSNVAEHCADRAAKLLILQEALEAARSQSEPNRVVVVSAWPLSAMATDFRKEALGVVYELLDVCESEHHGLRKLDALSALIQATMSLDKARELVLPKFEEAASRSHGWRSDRLVAWVATNISQYDRGAAKRLLRCRPENRFSKIAAKQVESGEGLH